jgi:hypothetical protein
MKHAVIVMAAVVEGAVRCRVRGAVDLERFGHVRRGGDRFEALRRRNQIEAASRALIGGLPL